MGVFWLFQKISVHSHIEGLFSDCENFRICESKFPKYLDFPIEIYQEK